MMTTKNSLNFYWSITDCLKKNAKIVLILATITSISTVINGCDISSQLLVGKKENNAIIIETHSPLILEQYRSQAEGIFQESLTDAITLHNTAKRFIDNPTSGHHQDLKIAYRHTRTSYSQSEALRFGNWFVDEWEHEVNAWPIDEGLIDYVDNQYQASVNNLVAQHNLVRNPVIELSGKVADITRINRRNLEYVQGISDFESNVTTGFHAVEFLIYGQDNYPDSPGRRPTSDFFVNNKCTSGINKKAAPIECQRRGQLLLTLTDKLVFNLTEMQGKWPADNGSYGDRLVKGDYKNGLRRILYGIDRLIAEELSGERLQVALYSASQEDELDCFSDTTHNSLLHNLIGAYAFYTGINSSEIQQVFEQIYDDTLQDIGNTDHITFKRTFSRGASATLFQKVNPLATSHSIATLTKTINTVLAETINQHWQQAFQLMMELYYKGENGIPFDQQIILYPQGIENLVISLQQLVDVMQPLKDELQLTFINPTMPFSS